jgi:transposase-like protein
MQEAPAKKERLSVYNTYTNEDRLRYFFFIQEKLMKPAEAARLANVNPETARKWKRAFDNDPEQKIPLKKTNRTSNRAPSQLNEQHKAHLVDFFDENPSAVIQDAVDSLTKSFEGLQIKKSRVAEFMKDDCNLSKKRAICAKVLRGLESSEQWRVRVLRVDAVNA